MMNKELCAYTAGIFDGEGHATIEKIKPKNEKQNERFALNIGIDNTNYDVINMLHTNFGLTIVYKRALPSDKLCYALKASGDKAIEFLNHVYPFLIIKKRQADVAIEFQKRLHLHRGRVLTLAEVSERRKLYLTMIKLNRRGKPVEDLAG